MSTVSTESAGSPAELRARLIEQAARILGEEGPSALSARRLATAAGTSTMAVYTHFGSMAGVVDEVATEGFRRLIDHVDAVVAAPFGDGGAGACCRARPLEHGDLEGRPGGGERAGEHEGQSDRGDRHEARGEAPLSHVVGRRGRLGHAGDTG